MKVAKQALLFVSPTVLTTLVAASHHNAHYVRQESSTINTPAPTATVSSASLPLPPSVTVPGQSGPITGPISTGSLSSTISLTFTLASINPTAIPLSDIIPNAPSQATRPLDTTFAPGSQPTFLPGAPPIPTAVVGVSLIPRNYPPLDKIPPTDSPEVRQWIQEVIDSGVPIPDIPPNVAGGCVANPEAVADRSRCWWTCTGCTRETDITQCPDKNHWGLTYDDGPSFHTSDLLDFLDQNKLKSTFFVVGSRALSFPDILQTQYMTEHQISVHTWSHPQLTTLTTEQVIAELGWAKKIIKDVLGVTPNTMRPPYGDIDDRVRAISIAMGLTPIMWSRTSTNMTYDTGDFNIAGGSMSAEKVLDNWHQIIGFANTSSNGFIVLEHDLFQQSVDIATGYILPDALAHQPPFVIEPVIKCLNLELSDAYVETNDDSRNPPAASKASAIPISTTTVNLNAAAATGGSSPSTSPSGPSNAEKSSAGSSFSGVYLLSQSLLVGAASMAVTYIADHL